jgi:serine/threonine protein kinase
MAIVFCSNCGAGNTNGGKFCSLCGNKLQNALSASSTPTGLLPAQTLLKQRYRVLQTVGKGGMGAVYMAQDSTLGDRLVAVKEMSQSSLSPQELRKASENFKHEAYMLANLQHPNLPSIHDYFEEQGRWYLVMNFIQGETLEAYLARSKKLPIEEVLPIALSLCSVLEYLHTYNPPIIFRDLKPSNIMRTPQAHIYLIDFGIARLFKPDQQKDTANYGSAGYSPPEQYGRAQTSPRSDIYSLGVTLYALLSGYAPSRSPFRLPPLESQVPGLPSRLVTLITRMLSLDEDLRPDNIKEVKQELDQLSAPAPSQALFAPPAPVPPTILPTKPAFSPPRPKPQVPKPMPVADPYVSNQHPVADPYAASHLNQILTPPPPPVKRTSAIRIIFAILGLTLGSLITLTGIFGASLANTAQQSNYTIYQDLSLGSLFFFLGLLLILISIIRKKGLPLSKSNKIVSILGLIIGIISCPFNFYLIIISYSFSFFDDLTYSCISLILGIIIIIVTRPRK